MVKCEFTEKSLLYHSSFDKAYKSFLEHYQDIGTTVKIKYETAITPVQADILTKEQLKELL